jgi:uncharacterized protein (TIGR02145 family)
MKNSPSKFALTVSFSLALVFTFSCTSGGGNDDGGSSSSVGGGERKKCGGVVYDPDIYRCEAGELIGKCKGADYYPAYQQCVGGVIVDGSSSSSSSVGSVSSSSVAGGGGSSSSSVALAGGSCDISGYRKVTIGTQTWLAENLNCDVAGSVCYANDPANCDKYGRLYDWATAMALDASCNSSSCASRINAPHRGICPSGWHIPSNDDWDELVNLAGGSSTAGTKLKSREGWNTYSGVPSGTDEFGFSALPGGNGTSGGSFIGVGGGGHWWSASEPNSYIAGSRYMYYSSEILYYYGYSKSNLYSVRCLQD